MEQRQSFLLHFYTMKVHVVQLCHGKSKSHSIQTSLLLVTLMLIFLTIIPLYLLNRSQSPEPKPSPKIGISDLRSLEKVKECDVFSGRWIPYSKGPYYTNETCRLIIDQQNCMKFGRPDTEFMKWRWRPEECELPFFNAMEFLELVRGKFMAFVGDSVGRNQMQSLLCLLGSVAYPQDISDKYTSDTTYFKRWFYSQYKFTLATLWSPFLVRAQDADASGRSLNSLMSLHLDKVDVAWASQIENFDYVIISAGQWFFRPLIYYINDQIVGCHNCNQEDITTVTKYYGYRMAFRTAFKTLQKLKNYKGITILRTFSPSHFENGAWNEGGSCERTRPFTNQEKKLDGYTLEFYFTQVEELRKAEREGRKKGLKLRLLATTEAMLLRPDGHPNRYGNSLSLAGNTTIPDCVHWCLPGPVDTWNELLLYMLKREAWGFSVRRN